MNIGLGAIVAALAAVAAVWRRSVGWLVVAVVAATGEIAYRRWLAHCPSDLAHRLKSSGG